MPIFGLIALLAFVLAFFNAHVGSLSVARLVIAGFAFLTLHLIVGSGIAWPVSWRHRPPPA